MFSLALTGSQYQSMCDLAGCWKSFLNLNFLFRCLWFQEDEPEYLFLLFFEVVICGFFKKNISTTNGQIALKYGAEI